MSQLPMPFVEVQDVDIAFGGIPNFDEALAACPKNFWESSDPWNQTAQTIYAELSGMRPMTEPQREAFNAAVIKDEHQEARWRYVKAWVGPFRPRHEDKEAIIAWCASQAMVGLPKSIAA